MTIHVLGKVVADSGEGNEPFIGVRETVGTVLGRPGSPCSALALLSATRLSCKAHGAGMRSARQCVACERFVNYRPSRDRRRVTVRCRWEGHDRVRDLMTPASALVTLPVDAQVGDARRVAADYGSQQMLVVDEGMLVGIVCRADIAALPSREPLSRHMSRRMWITFPGSTLADAARIMSEHEVSCLPVVEDGRLCGLLCRGDLIEVGWVIG